MLTFGTKRKNVTESDFNGNYLRNFKTGETKVRFLEEPDEWVLYQEHYTRDRKAFPCTGDTRSCPGCTSDDEQVARRSRKYGTFVYLVEPNAVLPFKMPMSLANRLTARAERNDGTITNRDYVVIRSGEGLKTEYDVDNDERYSMDISAQLAKATGTIEGILSDMFQQVWGDPKQYEKPADEYSPKKEQPFQEEVPDTLKTHEERFKPEADAPTQSSEEELTEAQVRGMNMRELYKLWDKAGWEQPEDFDDWGKPELVENILKRAE